MPSRVLFPLNGFTLADAAAYYRKIAPYLLPHLRKRPISFKRFPETVLDESYWEKDLPPFAPAWIRTFPVPRRSGRSHINYVIVDNLRTLSWLVEVGGIELHPFLHTAPRIDRPTAAVFDLDPGPGASIIECAAVALLLRDLLVTLGLDCYSKTSGSKGMQLYVPLNTATTHQTTEAFARTIAERMARTYPSFITARMAKEQRSRKIFIDYNQNADFKTTIGVYSLRGKRPEPFVSAPLRWREVEEAATKGDRGRLELTPGDVLTRARKWGDLFAPLLTLRQKLPAEFAAIASKTAKAKPRRDDDDDEEIVVRGIRLPKPRSQSSRRLFVLPKTDTGGDELWLDIEGKFERFILRPDREGKGTLVAMPAGRFPVAASWYRGKVQREYQGRVKISDIGAWEIIEGSFARERLVLFFEGATLQGRWLLEKNEPGPKHKSWRLEPVRPGR